ncbi:MAG: hypothetical protein LBL66_04785 [Clostridiales bacterium]|jgi:hypothetical protein|nr:hypothetical protein [Clostridiales bacterium]
MKIKIPYNRREITDGKLINNYGEITAELDLSINAERKWEAHFPALAEKETVFAYVERIQNAAQTPQNTAAVVISSIKALYCFLNSDDLESFDKFAGLFDLSDAETIRRQVKTLETALRLVESGSAASSKN